MTQDKQDQPGQQQKVSLPAIPVASGGSLANSSHALHKDQQGGGSNELTAEATGKSTASPRRVRANRQNSRKSTGPRTPNGKKRASMNAVKHGFFSKFLLVQHPEGKVSQSELDKFYAGVRKHYQSVGFLEELWMEKIAVWSWRLRRLIRFESGQIARALAGHSYELQQSRADDPAEPDSVPLSNPEMDAMTDHLFLPEKEELDRLLRYEAMINRQLNHAIAELERLQARRKGETTSNV
ncbi:MAG: hypothetical protein LAO18_24250 [Acidobacteriia bacterium]|nr:hypothetical protein [Terriglobia bacterium]